MKIGIDCRTILNPGKGEQAGIGHYTYYLVRKLLKIDHKNKYVLFFDNRISDQTVKLLGGQNKNVQIKFFPFYYYKNYLPTAYSQILVGAFINREKLDLLHAPANIVPPRYVGKAIVTVHDLAIYKNPSWLPSNFLPKQTVAAKMLVAKSLHQVDKIIAVSEHTKKDITKLFNISEKKIRVIYEGVLPDRELKLTAKKNSLVVPNLPALRKKFGLNKSYVLFVGTIEARKNLIGLIKAWQSFLARQRVNKKSVGKDFQLVLAGGRGWQYKEVLKTIDRLKLKKQIKYLDYVSHQEKIGLLENAQCFVFPSLYEGFGLPVLEAMSFGLPVIASRVAALPEVAGDAALLINPNKISDIVQALEKVLGDKKTSEQLSRAGKRQAKKFNWRKTARQTLAVYKEVIKAKK